MKESEYGWALNKAKEILGDKISYAFEKSNYDCDLYLQARIEKATCPTCFQETTWRSDLALVDSDNNFDINKLPESKRIQYLATWIEKVKIQLKKSGKQ